jgi:RNA polymerase-binding protein DksA
MRSTLDAHQTEAQRRILRDRARQLRQEIRDTLKKSDSEQYTMIADQVRDLEDDSFADLMVDVNLAEIDRDLQELRLIDAAFLRLSDGSYGRCEDCELPIEIERLRATPFASRCFDCQTSYERNHVQNIGHTM